NRMSCLANKQALGRIADILLYLSEKIFNGQLIENIISRKDIAELAGMSTESAVRILSELNRDKIIKIVNKGIEISNLALLKKLSIAG
ncbi:MAG TPA: helix-turn-helix domain-containing protein, partial [Bacteroidia bacterium]|nr:helix-turn-helix domain-containing protein [Bacteroidia bacterium]